MKNRGIDNSEAITVAALSKSVPLPVGREGCKTQETDRKDP